MDLQPPVRNPVRNPIRIPALISVLTSVLVVPLALPMAPGAAAMHASHAARAHRSPAQDGAAPGAPSTPEELAERLESLYHGAFDVDDMRDPFETYFSTGIASERVAAYLREAAEVTARLRETPPTRRNAAYGSNGPITHLRTFRIESRALSILGRSAGMRGDRAAMAEHLARSARLALVAARDRVLVSSLVAEGIAANALQTIEDAIDAGHVDQAAATTIRAGMRGLEAVDALGFSVALAGQSEFLMNAIAGFDALDPAARAARLAEIAERNGFGHAEVGPISDEELARGRDLLGRLYGGLADAFASEDREARASELDRVIAEYEAEVGTGDEADAGADEPAAGGAGDEHADGGSDGDSDGDGDEDGEDARNPFHHLMRVPSMFQRYERRLVDAERLLAKVDGALRELESGARSPEEVANAAPLYVRAADAVRRLAPDAQEAIETLRSIPDDAPEEIVVEARERIEALRSDVVGSVLRAARFGRADFDARKVPGFARHVRLAEPGSIGSTGAMRVVLADALDLRPRREGEPAPIDAATAVLAAVRHYAGAGHVVHSLCAELMARDLVEALAVLEARGAFDAAARMRIRAELARFDPGDPFGWRRATDAERGRLVEECARLWPDVDRDALERLDPNETFCVMLAALALPDGCLVVLAHKEPECAGPLVDLRPHFDGKAMGDALAQWRQLAGPEDDERDGAARLAAFKPTVPLDVVARIRAQGDRFAALARFGGEPSERPSETSDGISNAMPSATSGGTPSSAASAPQAAAQDTPAEVEPPADDDAEEPAADETEPQAFDLATASREAMVERLNELWTTAFNKAEDADPWDVYLATGVATAEVEAYVSEAAAIAARLEAMPRPERSLDFSQGTNLLLPHLGGMRHEARAYTVLARAAGLRGDRAAQVGFCARAVDLARDAASDGTTISSLVARAIGSATIAAVEKAIDVASLDQTSAAAMREEIRALGAPDAFQFARALERERDMLEVEAGLLRAIDPALRAARVRERSGVGKADEPDPPYTDEALERDLAAISRYYAAAGSLFANPDRASARVELDRLREEWERELGKDFSDGRLGPLGTMALPPDSIERTFDSLCDLEKRQARVDASLRELASGAATAEERADAGLLYVRAAEAMRRLSPAEQDAVEVLRRIGPDAPAELAREARERIRALRTEVIDPILEASRRPRAEFVRPAWRQVARALLLAEAGSIGSTGAMRMLLADALDVRARGEGDVAPADAVVAVLRAVANYSDAALLVHSLCAELMARDLVDALATLEARGAIDAAMRERIRREIGRFRPDDPFGWRRATDLQREEVVRNSLASFGVDREALGRLDANATLFLLVATLAGPDQCLALAEGGVCRCEGPLVDLRQHFDVEAIRSARAQWLALLESDVPPAGRYARLLPTVPLDVEARTRAQADSFTALARFADPPRATAPADVSPRE